MPPREPRLLEVIYFTAADEFTAVFDAPLAPGVLDGPNWQFTLGLAFWKRGTVVNAHSRWVTGATQPAVFGPAAGTCTYAPPPFDVQSRAGVPLSGFTDFPMTILP